MAAAIFKLAAGFILLAVCAVSQPRMSLEEASRRKFPDLAPRHTGEVVTIEGTVAGVPYVISDFSHLVIQDPAGTGFTLEASREIFSSAAPGSRIRVTGVIANRAGLPVLHPRTITKIGQELPPTAAALSISDLNRANNIGRYVVTEGYVLSSSQNAGGDVMLIGDRLSTLAVFLPKKPTGGNVGLRKYRPGDKVRVAGISSQYCPIEPYDRGYQIIVDDTVSVSGVSRGWFVATDTLLYVFMGLLGALGVWWLRERMLAGQRRIIRSVMSLSEEILTAPAAADIARKLENTLPELLGTDAISLYLFKSTTNTLERAPDDTSSTPFSISVDAPMGSLGAAAALCFRNRALLEIPNVYKSPLIDRDIEPSPPRAAVFVPLIAQSELLGVLELRYRTTIKRMSDDHRSVMQHLGNQIAASLRLEEQQWLREQLLRTEKMAAAGQLISAVADELREPLLNISRLAAQASLSDNSAHSELADITTASQRGVDVVEHLVGLARMNPSEPKLLDIFALVSSIVQIRQEECVLKGITLDAALPLLSAQVFGDRSQLEQVFIGLLLTAERVSAASSAKNISVTGRLIGRRVQITVAHTIPEPSAHADGAVRDDSEADVRVWQALLQAHDGALKVMVVGPLQRAQVNLPVHEPATAYEQETPKRKVSRCITALLIEPDVQLQRRILATMSARGHRVVPASKYESAADLVQRFPFDAVFCEENLADSNWVDFYQRVRRRVSSFVLITDSEGLQDTATLRSGEILSLTKPVREADLDRLLRIIEAREPALAQTGT